MFFLYRTLTYIIFIFLPLVAIYRILKKKEHLTRFLEKFGKINQQRKSGKLIWFHGSSVGEILSIVPLIKKFEKKKDVGQILLTTNTLSSSKIFLKFKFKKTKHQFFPVDVDILVNNFLNYWKPDLAVFVDSEVWPITLNCIKNRKIPLILINARITEKSFKRWSIIKSFSYKIFNKFDLCLAQNNETIRYLKKLGAKKIKKAGNLKFAALEVDVKNKLLKKQKEFFKRKQTLFCAVSTHNPEENFCKNLHKSLSKYYKNPLTIIIPRHIERSLEIKNDLEKKEFITYLHSSRQKIHAKTAFYIVDTFGETKTFLKLCKIAFVGGTMINHGGQNPLEAARLGCSIVHGPSTHNFYEVYNLLEKLNISRKINSLNHAKKIVNSALKKRQKTNKNVKKLIKLGNKILINNQIELEKFFQ